MTHPPYRVSALLLPVMLLAWGPALRGQGAALYQPRLAAVEKVLDTFYRGESLESAQKRVNARADRFNGQVKERNDELEGLQAQVQRELAPTKDLEATLQAQDQALATPPDAADQDAVRRYNERVKARNALAARYNQQRAAAQGVLDAFNARTRTLDTRIEQERAGLDADQKALKARVQAYTAFHEQGSDLAFFAGLNRLLADLRAASRKGPDPDLQAALERVRGYRRELAEWANGRESSQADGLVLVAALVGDEPCCFIVDTGAQLVCLPVEIIDALGLGASLGAESTLTLAGGQKIRGRSVTLPRIAAAGMAAKDVAGSAVPASEVGIDGLLGQSFLKHFVYTIDEGRAGKLVLVPRQP
jgi:clan AA aspartic protease (TIGR02281 family)